MKKLYSLFTALLLSSSLFSQQTVLYNKGFLYVEGDIEDDSPASLFIKGDICVEDDSKIHQQGKTVLTGDFVNNVTSGNVFIPSDGKLEFKGISAQKITGNADKANNYIDFPDYVVINNQTSADPDKVSVTIDPLAGATMKNLELKRGRLIIDSKTDGVNESHIAHLMIEQDGSISYNRSTSLARQDEGVIQVNLALGDNYTKKALVGFTPPFEKIYADYFFFNFLTRPTNKGLFGDKGMFIIDPTTPLYAGQGYIIGQGIVPDGDEYYEKTLNSNWEGAEYDDRAKEMFSFARRFAPESLTQFIDAQNVLDRFTGEALNIKDVPVELEKGFNYIGNPFTVPIDMEGFVNNVDTQDDWGITRGTRSDSELKNCFYVLSQGTGSYNSTDVYSPFRFNVSYLLGQGIGSTINHEGGESSYLITPMQMLAIIKNSDGNKTMNIPASSRTHGKATYLRKSSSYSITDELLIETKDMKTEGYDRLCIVFRDDATLASNDVYDGVKLFNKSGGVNQIYTLSSDNKTMTTNVISPGTQSLTMYFEPSKKEQNVSFNVYRTNSLRSISSVILEDKKNGQKTDLLINPTYEFISSPLDKTERFVLHFFETPTSIDELTGNVALNSFYNKGIINVSGLTDKDLGGSISIVSTQGYTIHQQEISEISQFQITKALVPGTYIIKLEGNYPRTCKLLTR